MITFITIFPVSNLSIQTVYIPVGNSLSPVQEKTYSISLNIFRITSGHKSAIYRIDSDCQKSVWIQKLCKR